MDCTIDKLMDKCDIQKNFDELGFERDNLEDEDLFKLIDESEFEHILESYFKECRDDMKDYYDGCKREEQRVRDAWMIWDALKKRRVHPLPPAPRESRPTPRSRSRTTPRSRSRTTPRSRSRTTPRSRSRTTPRSRSRTKNTSKRRSRTKKRGKRRSRTK